MNHARASVSKFWIVASLFLLVVPAGAGPSSKFDVPPSGETRVSGLVKATNRDGVYTIGGHEFRFAQGKIVGGTQFDEQSRRALVGQNLIALLKQTATGSVMTAAIPNGMFSVLPSKLNAEESRHFRNHVKIDGAGSGLTGRPMSEEFQKYLNYRATLPGGREVKAGDSALILTFSGSQGDDFGASMGHFAFGQGHVLPNGELAGEISNFYPTKNEKDIQPGHVNLVDYYGNFVSGQSQYRPVFSMVIYGVSKDALQAARENMDQVFSFLFNRPNFQISIDNNCTTESCETLKAAGIDPMTSPEGAKYFALNSLRSIFKSLPAQPGRLGKFLYFLFEDPAHFLPRRSFDRALQNMVTNGTLGDEQVARVDYVFHGQVPSARARGGLSPKNLNEYAEVTARFAPGMAAGVCSRLANRFFPTAQ